MSYDVLVFLSGYSVYILSGVLVATITGLLGYLIWLLLVKGAAKFAVEHAMTYMKFEIVCFVLPIICSIIYKVWKVRTGWQIKPSTVPVILCLLALTVLWMVVVIMVLIYQYLEYRRKRLLFVLSKPVEDKRILAVVDKWKSRLGIHEKTTLFYNERIDSPCIMYNKGYHILLPRFPMTEKELNMALLHELIHLKHGDIRIKDIAFVAGALHFFNPASYFLQKEIAKWCEVRCDWSCCEIGKEEFSRKEYFDSIMAMKERSKRFSYSETMCCLMEDTKLVKFRVDMMGLQKDEKSGSRVSDMVWMVALMAAVMAFSFQSISSSLTYWTEGIIYFAKENSQETTEKVPATQIFDNVEIGYWDGDILNRDESADFELGSENMEIFEFSEQHGNVVTAYVMCNDGNYQMGWIGEDGHIEYVDCSGSTSMDFELGDERVKQFFIKNTGKTSCKMEVFLGTSDK